MSFPRQCQIFYNRYPNLLRILFVLLQIWIFFLGRFSVQISNIERNLSIRSDENEIFSTNSLKSTIKLKTHLLILIMTRPEDSNNRNLIRKTWLKLSTKTPTQFLHIFPIGIKKLPPKELEELKSEQNEHNDLIFLENLIENYRNLTQKTAFSIKLAVQNFQFDFLLKVDADSFVKLGSLLKSLNDIEHPKLYWGFLDGRAKPFLKGKWKESEWKLCDRYLPYQLGAGYVISYRLANFISQNLGLLKFYRSEDVSVGAWLAGLDVKYVHDPRFDTESQSRGCNNEYLVTHRKSNKEMEKLFETIQNKGVLCEQEYQTRPSYVYDFAALPSQCCIRKNNSKIP